MRCLAALLEVAILLMVMNESVIGFQNVHAMEWQVVSCGAMNPVTESSVSLVGKISPKKDSYLQKSGALVLWKSQAVRVGPPKIEAGKERRADPCT